MADGDRCQPAPSIDRPSHANGKEGPRNERHEKLETVRFGCLDPRPHGARKLGVCLASQNRSGARSAACGARRGAASSTRPRPRVGRWSLAVERPAIRLGQRPLGTATARRRGLGRRPLGTAWRRLAVGCRSLEAVGARGASPRPPPHGSLSMRFFEPCLRRQRSLGRDMLRFGLCPRHLGRWVTSSAFPLPSCGTTGWLGEPNHLMSQ